MRHPRARWQKCSSGIFHGHCQPAHVKVCVVCWDWLLHAYHGARALRVGWLVRFPHKNRTTILTGVMKNVQKACYEKCSRLAILARIVYILYVSKSACQQRSTLKPGLVIPTGLVTPSPFALFAAVDQLLVRAPRGNEGTERKASG